MTKLYAKYYYQYTDMFQREFLLVYFQPIWGSVIFQTIQKPQEKVIDTEVPEIQILTFMYNLVPL